MRTLAQQIYEHILYKERVKVKSIISEMGLMDSVKMRKKVIECLREIGRESKPVYDRKTKQSNRYWIKK